VTIYDDIQMASIAMLKIKDLVKQIQLQRELAYIAIYALRCELEIDAINVNDCLQVIPDTIFVHQVSKVINSKRASHTLDVTNYDDKRVYVDIGGNYGFLPRNFFIEEDFSDVTHVNVELPPIDVWSQLGFMIRRGIAPVDEYRDLSRLYLNIHASDAYWVMGKLADCLDDEKIPFDIKACAHPRAYIRHDCCVLYVPTNILVDATTCVLDTIAKNKIEMSNSTPLLTMRVARGVGIADEPSDCQLELVTRQFEGIGQ
jgi:hypothetical protein